MNSLRAHVVALVLGMSATTVCSADQVITDDVIVRGVNGTGSECVGNDCINGEAFDGDTLRLKENNLRIRLHDISAPAGLGQSWSITANGSNNGGRSYFNFELKSLEKDTLLISDGTYPLYDCSQPDPYNPAPTQKIPAGEPVTQPVPSGPGTYDCLTVTDYTVKPIVQLGTASTNAVALGYDSELSQDTVSVGKAGLSRQLKHVAEGLADTDLLITKTLSGYSAYAAQHDQIAAVTQQLDDIDTQLDDIEAAVTKAEDRPPSVPELVSPADGATGLDPNAVTLSWRRANDPDGDPLSYRVRYCERADFNGCSPITVASKHTAVLFAALGGGSGIALLGFVAPGMRRKNAWRNWLSIASAVAILTACGGSGSSGDDSLLRTTISGLKSATTYYWKVEVTDGTKTTESAVRSFTTQ